MALAMVGVPVFVYLPKFYTDVVGVSMTAFGAVFLAARAFDAVTDPWIGALSDRSRNPRGRRLPFIAKSALPLAICVLWLYAPPEGPVGASPWWFATGVIGLFLFWTTLIVPYKSLGPELTQDYDERTGLFAMREASLVVGTLLAAALPVAIEAALPGGASDQRLRFQIYAAIAVVVLLWACWWCVRRVPESPPPPDSAEPGKPEPSIAAGIKQALSNRPFRILLIAYAVIAIGSNLPAALITYFVAYVLGQEDVGIYLIVYFTIGITLLPLWVRAASRLGKKRVWLAAMAVNTLAFAPVLFLSRGDEWIYGICVALSGTAGVATIALPNAIQADVMEYDELLSGRRREGRFMGLWSIAEKLAAAFGVGVALPILEASGYRPNVEQPAHVLWTLKLLYVAVPVSCNVVAFVIASRYPIDRSAHLAIRHAVEERRMGRDVLDPLDPTRTLPALRNPSLQSG